MQIHKDFIFAVGLISMLLPTTASAADEWEYRITPYIWFAGVEGDASTIPGAPVAPIDVSPSDAISDTKTSFMGVFEMKKGKHGGFIDTLYSDVQSDTVLVPSPINLTLKTTSKNTLVSAGYEYELYKNEQAFADAFVGARYWKVDTKLEFGGGLGALAGQSIRNSESWVDPLIGIKGQTALGQSKFFAYGILGVGGFGVGSEHFYDASVHLGYQWTKLIGTTIGYRRYDVKYEHDSFFYDITQQGWLLGVSFAF